MSDDMENRYGNYNKIMVDNKGRIVFNMRDGDADKIKSYEVVGVKDSLSFILKPFKQL